ncbi:MAG: glycosyltransferase family 9 protein [Candidatus Methylacidiphilales bacterium]
MNWKINNWKEKAIYGASVILSKLINGKRNINAFTPKKIVCIKLDEIGDLCYCLHVFDLLKQAYPNAQITVLCKPFAVNLLANNPNIHLATSLWSDITDNYDTIIDLRGNWKSIFHAILNMPKIRLDRGTIRLRNKKAGKHPHEVITNLQIISPLLKEIPEQLLPKIYIANETNNKVIDYLKNEYIQKFVVFHTGARKKLRQWSQQNFAQLAIYLKNNFDFEILFVGDSSDVEYINEIQQLINFKTHNTAGLFNLVELASLIKKSELYVGNESGPLCIAAISGAKTLGLFGPGEPNVFYPYGTHTAYIHHVLSCNPCDQIKCVNPTNTCMQMITQNEVIIACNKLLSLG